MTLSAVCQRCVVVLVSLVTINLAGCASQSVKPKPIELSWNTTVEKVSSGVVSIQTDVPVSFDGTWNRSSYATGFVVDATRGILLTNRHVVTAGPITGRAILINNEEIDLTPLYVDPVHDFGFFKYDPKQIKHISPHEFRLDPKSAHVGQEIRIIGNDAGQKIAILDGTISRLDRDAPNYGKYNYNDFNTYYMQAATASTGGSSGSPVINKRGDVVALNAGSQSQSANAFYLPLDAVKNALEKLQKGQLVSRGSLKTTFQATPYAELKRLGLDDEREAFYRKNYPDLKGLLVADSMLPPINGEDVLEVGDILLSIEQEKIIDFLSLENILNQCVNKSVNIEVLRRGLLVQLSIKVADLSAMTPTQYLKIDGGVYHNLSYQQARHFNRNISGVYSARSANGFTQAGVPHHSVITHFNGQAIKDLQQFNQQLSQIPDDEKVHVRYITKRDPVTPRYALVEVKRTWYQQSLCTRNQTLGYWPCSTFEGVAKSVSVAETGQSQNQSTLPEQITAAHVAKSLVHVKFSGPYSIQGRVSTKSGFGAGIVVDANKGWVVVDRSVVFSVLGDVKLIFGNQIEVTGKVEYVHPLHNLVLLSYPVEQVKGVEIVAAPLVDKKIKVHQAITQIGLNNEGKIELRDTQVDSIQEIWQREFGVPQFVQKNMEVVHLVNPNAAIDGVLVDEHNQVLALWAVFEESNSNGKGVNRSVAGITSEYILELKSLMESERELRSLEASLTQIAPVSALQRGLPESWLNKIIDKDNNQELLLTIYDTTAESPASKVFRRGDILLAIDEQPVSSFRQVERIVQKPQVKVTFFREGQVMDARVDTVLLSGRDIDRVFFWSGLFLHQPHRAAQVQRNVPSSGLYVASYSYGSPANRYNIVPMRRIVEIDGVSINDADDFIDLVKGKSHGESVMLKTVDFDNKPDVITLKLDNNYWPFYEIKYESGAWIKVEHQ